MKKIIILFTIACGLFSCKSDFLDTYPKDGIGSSAFWDTEEHALLGITAIYSTLNSESYYSEIGMDDVLSPIACRLTNDGWDNYNMYNVYKGTADSRTSYFSQRWKIIYRGINRANDAIVNLPKTTFKNEATRKRFMAEAKFLRALFYFDLLNFYGGQDDATDGGVPLYLEVVDYNDSYRPRTKPSEVRKQILADLQDAISELPNVSKISGAEIGRATKGAAIALLGKTYLYNKEWQKAANTFSGLIQSGDYSLHSNYLDMFQVKGERNKEVIFNLEAIAIAGGGTWMDIRYGNASSGSRAKNASIPTNYLADSYQYKDGTTFDMAAFKTKFKADYGRDFSFKNKSDVAILYGNRDPRLAMNMILPFTTFVGLNNQTYEYRIPYDSRSPGDGKLPEVQYSSMRTNKNNNNHYSWRKFADVGDDNKILRYDSPINIPIIRFADVLLMFAEARNESGAGFSANAQDSIYLAVNKVRSRPGVGMPIIPVGDQNTIRQKIRAERMIELAGEGIYFSDIRRWFKGNPEFDIAFLKENVMDLEGSKKIESRNVNAVGYFLWPIPMGEIEMNQSLLPQNPGWEL